MTRKSALLAVVVFLAAKLPGYGDDNPPGVLIPENHLSVPRSTMTADTLVSIKGIVKDSKDEPLIGVSILVEGTTLGTTTDVEGKFSLDRVPANGVLKLSYIGFIAESIPVNNRSSFEIVMREDQKILEEIVVVGFGSQKKKVWSDRLCRCPKKLSKETATSPTCAKL